MDATTILLGLAILFGLYMAWGIGANDVANAMATSVGSRALQLSKQLLLQPFSNSLVHFSPEEK